jgi:hypothetical protein
MNEVDTKGLLFAVGEQAIVSARHVQSLRDVDKEDCQAASTIIEIL